MIEGVRQIKLQPFVDKRGLFAKTLDFGMIEGFGMRGVEEYFFSKSDKFVWRGMHLQTGQQASNRIIYCTNGAVNDFLIDLRKNSPTFLGVLELELNAEDTMDGVFVPAGVAHGFLSMVDYSEVHYISDKSYKSEFDTGVNPFSIPFISKRLAGFQISLSERDKKLPTLDQFVESHSGDLI